MVDSFLDEDIQKLVTSGMAQRDDILGCSASDILSFEANLGLKLPEAYKAFLLRMGRGAGKFLPDFAWRFDEFEWMRNLAFESSLLTKQEKEESEIDLSVFSKEEAQFVFGDMTPSYEVELEASHHVFLMRAGDYYLYFDTKEGDDPPVYKSDQESVFYNSFSTWLHDAVDGETKIFKGELTPNLYWSEK